MIYTDNRYWGLSDAERAELTEDQVREYCRTELMNQGVLEAKAPELLDETKPETETITVYVPHRDDRTWATEIPIAFRTIAEAENFADLRPMYLEHDYSADVNCAKPIINIKIERKEVLSEEELLRARIALEQVTANKKVNREAEEEFKKAAKAAAEVTDGVWDDWHRARRHARELDNVRETFSEYLTMCGGDSAVASKFIVKTFNEKLVKEAITDLLRTDTVEQVEG